MHIVAEADKFEAAVAAVRQSIRDRAVAPGEALLVDSLARRLRMSATPIREALAYLSGAGMAERQGRGYRVPRLDPSDVIELYQLHGAYVRLALEQAALDPHPLDPASRGADAPSEPTYRGRVEAFWRGLVAAGRHDRLQRALHRLADQLALVRMAEPRVFADAEAELEALARRREADSQVAFRAAVEAYHRRRIESATALSAAIYWPLSGGKI
jgi:DNA-binding GntR family transcriptional regulator